MKIILRSLFLLVVIIGMTSCGDDEPIGESYGNVIPENSQFKVDIDGSTYYAQASGVLTEDGVTQIVGKRFDGTLIKMVFSGGGTGTYSLNGTPSGNAFYYDGNEEPFTMADIDSIGNVTITKYDVNNSLASGTFEFMVQRSDVPDSIPSNDSTQTTPTGGIKKFEKGEFTNIPLHTDLAPEPGEDIGNFQVKLDGDLYTATSINSSLTASNGLIINTSRAAKHVNLQVSNPSQGTFDLSGSDALVIYNADINSGQAAMYSASNGTITISEIDTQNHLVSGTFDGTLSGISDSTTISMTEGVFEDIPYATSSDTSGSGFMNAKADNEDFGAGSVSTTDLVNGLVGITGIDDVSGDELQLNVPYDVLTGSYSISTDGAFSAVYMKDGIEYQTIANSGTFSIDERNGNVIEGSFMFSVRNDDGEVIQITQGEFKADIGI